jgi:hypothetical protein
LTNLRERIKELEVNLAEDIEQVFTVNPEKAPAWVGDESGVKTYFSKTEERVDGTRICAFLGVVIQFKGTVGAFSSQIIRIAASRCKQRLN